MKYLSIKIFFIALTFIFMQNEVVHAQLKIRYGWTKEIFKKEYANFPIDSTNDSTFVIQRYEIFNNIQGVLKVYLHTDTNTVNGWFFMFPETTSNVKKTVDSLMRKYGEGRIIGYQGYNRSWAVKDLGVIISYYYGSDEFALYCRLESKEQIENDPIFHKKD